MGYVLGMSTQVTDEPSNPRLLSAGWWMRSPEGTLALWQFPNPALGVWMLAVGISLFPLPPDRATQVDGVRHGALLVWALDEILRGASPFRRLLGVVVLGGQLAVLLG